MSVVGEVGVEVERHGSVARVWLSRPEKRNALNSATLRSIEQVFVSFQTEFDIRVVVLAGRGPSFCAGADRRDPPGAALLASSSDVSDRERRHTSQLGLRAVQAIADCEAVTLASVHGHAIGGGFGLALACDFRIAAADALFQVPEVELGVPLTWGITPLLIHEIGAARARELIVTCERVDAERAERIGLVHRSVPPHNLDAVVDDWAARLSALPEVAVHMTKTQFRAYRQRALLGDVRETDGDLLRSASRSAAARASFTGPK